MIRLYVLLRWSALRCSAVAKLRTSNLNIHWRTSSSVTATLLIRSGTGLRVLSVVGDAVPVRLMKRDLLFTLENLTPLMDESRLAMLARQHGIRQKRDDGGNKKTVSAFLRRADEGTLSRLLVETAILLAASRTNAATVLRDAASTYKVDPEAIARKVKQTSTSKSQSE
jgi:ParB family chromosome partitioning protein